MAALITRRVAVLGLLSACGYRPPRFLEYDGPEVTDVRIYKDARRMELWHNDQMLEDYRIGLGGDPFGHKQQQGDSRTPEGRYIIDRRNPNSAFHLSLGISYPNTDDIARAEAAGVDPGGDIFIHGVGDRFRRRGADWTEGCIAVSNREIEQIYAMVRNGTPVVIYP